MDSDDEKNELTKEYSLVAGPVNSKGRPVKVIPKDQSKSEFKKAGIGLV